MCASTICRRMLSPLQGLFFGGLTWKRSSPVLILAVSSLEEATIRINSATIDPKPQHKLQYRIFLNKKLSQKNFSNQCLKH